MNTAYNKQKGCAAPAAGRIYIVCEAAQKWNSMLYSEFKCKDVINIRDCKRLGRVDDLEFDECSGCIHKIIVPGGNKMLSFLHCEPDVVIPYKNIRQIGPDIILVDINC